VVPWAGILSGTSAAWLHGLLERLADEGLIERHGKGTILLTPRGVEIAATNDADGIAADGRANGAARTTYHDLLPQQAALGRNPREEQALADVRRRLAAEEGRPAFAIFDNLTLARLASARPKSLGELAGTDGLGAERVRRYGRAILRALATAESEAPSDARKGAPPRNPSSRRKNAKERGDETSARPRSRSGKAKHGA
ncbi:MAG TPA: HRDC domain-containing protein, partial [Planctomycetota bacterium]|nr:HRDC domain-containing protein [Planctomycetota bacterium]